MVEPKLSSGSCENCGSYEIVAIGNAVDYPKNILNRKSGDISVCKLCENHVVVRNESLKKLLANLSDKNLIVAGAGSGKSFSFVKILKELPAGEKALVFTLINNLVDGLKKDLEPLKNSNIDVNTFHGFCKKVLYSIPHEELTEEFKYCPELPVLIEEDAKALGYSFDKDDFKKSFANLEIGETMFFYMDRANYYDAVGHDDCVYRVYKFYSESKERIPSYHLIIADEYQDFNLLESLFIEALSEKSRSLLIAGDDDQALYRFRYAKPDFIRSKWSDIDYKKFELPFCSRCTPVIVKATNDFIRVAKSLGLLEGRIPRSYYPYWPDKFSDHELYPNILVAYCSTPKTGNILVGEKIQELVRKEGIDGTESDIQFLVIGPSSMFDIRNLAAYLSSTLDPQVYSIEVPTKDHDVDSLLRYGRELILDDENSNLGWRIILHYSPLSSLPVIIRETYERKIPLVSLLPGEYVTFQINEARKELGNQNKESTQSDQKKIRVKLTSIYGSKGLSALHTFVIGMNNGSIPESLPVTDDDVCKFIVALTRAKRSCTLVSNKWFDKRDKSLHHDPSVFFSMLPEKYLLAEDYSIKAKKLVSSRH